MKHEGLRTAPYTDTVGKLTIGVGHNLSDKGLTVFQVMAILKDDINDVLHFINISLPWVNQLDEVRQRVVADLAFVMMNKLLDFHRMLGYLQAKDWNNAADALLASKFATQTGQRAKDLAYMIRTGQDVI